MKWLPIIVVLSCVGSAAQTQDKTKNPQPGQSAQPQPVQPASIQPGRFQLVGKDVSVVCTLMCRIDTETGRVWQLHNGQRTNTDGEKETFQFWVYLPEDTVDAFMPGDVRPKSLP
jgi:hypothetical protein